jgi:hypothetical protein
VHELHIWQLSDVKFVASLHAQICLPQYHRVKRYYNIVRAIQNRLAAYGIQSSVIQPEFIDSLRNKIVEGDDKEEDINLRESELDSCLFEFVDDETRENSRCWDVIAADEDGDICRSEYGTEI